MKISRKKSKTGYTLTCDGELTIYTVMAAKSEFLANIDDAIESIALDFSCVRKLDTAGLQLLLFAKKSMADCNKRFFVKTSNEYIDSLLKEFNITDQFILEK